MDSEVDGWSAELEVIVALACGADIFVLVECRNVSSNT